MTELFNGEIKSWCSNIEETALGQIKNVSEFPFLHNYAALMPDCHTGFGVPIGIIFPTRDVIIPNAVGVDIACGMSAIKLNITYNKDSELYKAIMSDIRRLIPVGFDHHKRVQQWDGFDEAPDIKIIQDELQTAKKSLGTLGGGNHFIEIQKDKDDYIWVMVHSGSRNFGYRIAEYYDKLARQTSNYGHDLNYLYLDSKDGQEYKSAIDYASRFSYANRELMMKRIIEAFNKQIPVQVLETYNIHHNYAVVEDNIILHRKGATSANLNEYGIIPGSQGTCSYIVKGKGNPLSYNSCSHGAGRVMSRTKAKETLNLDDEIKLLDDKGIIHAIRNKKDLEESPNAYKNIEDVMNEQVDLVEIVHKLDPIAVIKG